MKKNKLKRLTSQILTIIKNIFSFYYIWVTIILLILAILSLKTSFYYNSVNNDFYASIYSNVFSGIIVGLVVLFVTGFKNFQRYNIETKLKKMEEIHNEILEYNTMCRRLLFNKDENYEEVAYEAICKAQAINTGIYFHPNIQLNNINFEKLFLKEFSFNVKEKSKECDNIREIILYDVDSANYRKDVNKYLEDYGRQLLLLNQKILTKIHNYNSKIKLIDKSIL